MSHTIPCSICHKATEVSDENVRRVICAECVVRGHVRREKDLDKMMGKKEDTNTNTMKQEETKNDIQSNQGQN